MQQYYFLFPKLKRSNTNALKKTTKVIFENWTHSFAFEYGIYSNHLNEPNFLEYEGVFIQIVCSDLYQIYIFFLCSAYGDILRPYYDTGNGKNKIKFWYKFI